MLHSIAIPTYNQAGYLADAIESALTQTVPAGEVVVSDNHSTDETSAVLARYEGRIRVVRPPEHLPMMAHWNFLVGELRGQWFSLLCSDDLIRPNFVETVVQGTRSCPDAVLIRAQHEVVGQEGRVLWRAPRLRLRPRRMVPPKTLYAQLTGSRVNLTTATVRRQDVLEVGGFPKECRLFGDWGLWLRIALRGVFYELPEVIGRYRADYRPGIARRRLHDELRDDVWIATRLVAEMLAGLQVADEPKVRACLRQRFHDRVAYASYLLAAGERGEAVEIIAPWARQVGCEELFERFRRGEFIATRWPLRQRLSFRAQQLVRRLAGAGG